MKKTIIFASAALIALAFASCQKDRLVEQENIGVASHITEFVAGIDPCSKLSLGNNGTSLLWDPGDEIGIYDGTANVVGGTIFATTINASAAVATFTLKEGQTGTPLTVDGKSYAVAPASALYSWRRDVTAAGITIPSMQTVSGPGQLPSGFPILYGSTSTGSITFHHAVGYICFTIGETSPQNIKAVTLTNLDEEQNLAGKFNINMNSGSIVKTSSSTNSVSMTLSISGGGNFPNGKYYIGLPPFTYEKGLKLTFQNEENLTDSKDIPAGKTLEAGTVQNIGTVSGLNFAGYVPSLGDPYPSTGTAEGIIVSIDAVNKKALVMSKDEASVFWADADHKSEVIGDFPTNSFTGGGKVATDSLITHFNALKAADPSLVFATVYPAAGWCVAKGDGWFMCSYQNEWKPMVSSFSVNTAAGFAAINEKLAAVGGTALKDNTYYWMISEKGTSNNPSYAGYAKFKTSDGSQDSGYASKKGNSTRPVRAFKTISY